MDVGDPLVQKAIEDLVGEKISPEALAAAKEESLKKAAEIAKAEEKSEEAVASKLNLDVKQ